MSGKKVQPCKECPFRIDSPEGWLGPGTGNPQGFIDALEMQPLHCHTVAENYGEDGLAKKKIEHPCIGAMQFMANSCKLPRGARVPGHYSDLFDKFSKPNKKVFKWAADFVKHHLTTSDQRKRITKL